MVIYVFMITGINLGRLLTIYTKRLFHGLPSGLFSMNCFSLLENGKDQKLYMQIL